MKNKRLLKHLAVLSFSGFLLAACGDDAPEETSNGGVETLEPDELEETEDESGEEPELSQNLEDWFPRLENVHYVYDGEGIEFAPFEWTPQFIHENTLQVSESTAGTTVVRIYEYSEDDIVEIFTREETYFREDFVDTGYPSTAEEYETILQLPIEEGHSWESETGATYEITGANIEVETPAGVYDALEVTRILEDYQVVHYYAEGIGLVHRVSYPEGEAAGEITSSLAEIQEDVSETIPVTLYTIDSQAMGIDTIEAIFTLDTNDPARFALADALRGDVPEMEETPLLTENVDINFMFLDANNVVNIDFSEELISEMNAGSGTEMLILQSLINSIGSYYNVEEIVLTVENEPYSSGHIVLEEGETLNVDYENVN